jgi:hypothetical protein
VWNDEHIHLFVTLLKITMPRKPLELRTHLTLPQITKRYRNCKDPRAQLRWHVVWLLSQPHQPSTAEVAQWTGYSTVWIRQIIHRYNLEGAAGLDCTLEPNLGGKPLVLNLEQQDLLFLALQNPAPDGKLWTGAKVARWCLEQTGYQPHAATGWSYIRRILAAKGAEGLYLSKARGKGGE